VLNDTSMSHSAAGADPALAAPQAPKALLLIGGIWLVIAQAAEEAYGMGTDAALPSARMTIHGERFISHFLLCNLSGSDPNLGNDIQG
jgi:hypothetical protein